MNAELVFYTHPMSRGRIVRWMLEELAVPYRAEIIDYGLAMKSAAYLEVNPMGKVPAIRHGDVIVTECAAICAYLADAFPEAGLAPEPGDPLRGPYYRWLFFGAGPIEAVMSNKALGFEPPVEARPKLGYGCAEDVTNTLERLLAGRRYLVGDRFSAADVYVGSQIMWSTEYGMLEKRPAFESYVAGVMSRPAAVRAREIDDALLPEHPLPGPAP